MSTVQSEVLAIEKTPLAATEKGDFQTVERILADDFITHDSRGHGCRKERLHAALRFSHVYVKRQGDWKMVTMQNTNVPGAAAH